MRLYFSQRYNLNKLFNLIFLQEENLLYKPHTILHSKAIYTKAPKL